MRHKCAQKNDAVQTCVWLQLGSVNASQSVWIASAAREITSAFNKPGRPGTLPTSAVPIRYAAYSHSSCFSTTHHCQWQHHITIIRLHACSLTAKIQIHKIIYYVLIITTARSELWEGSVFGAVSLWLSCMKYLRNCWTELRQIHTQYVFGTSRGRVWRSRWKVKVTRDKKMAFLGPFGGQHADWVKHLSSLV